MLPPSGEESGELALDPLERIAAEYCERRRAGEEPTVEEFAIRHPELAAELRRFLPTLDLLEGAVDPDLEIAPDASRPGSTVGQYRIVREVGRGGMGVVLEAVQEPLGRRVALKILPLQSKFDSHFLERFRREAKAAGKLQHPNIVPVFGSGEVDGVHYLAMQYVEGYGLDRVLKLVSRLWDFAPEEPAVRGSVREDLLTIVNGLRSEGFDRARVRPERLQGFSSEERRRYFLAVARIGLQVADALAYAHANGILHRDVKPSNLLLDAQGRVWVVDFGLCKPTESEDLTLAGDVLGTLRYMAPERLSGLSDVRSDVYSLGITLYELLTLRVAFADSTPAQLAAAVALGDPPRPGALQPGIPRDLDTIVHKATRLEPGARYATANALAEDLRAFLDERPISAHPPGLGYYLRLALRRNRALAATVAAALLLLLSTTVFYVARLDQARARAEASQRDEARQRLTAQLQGYVANVAAADGALRAGDVAQARKRLAAAPEELRNWEWQHLMSGLDRSSRTIALERAAVSAAAWDQAARAAAYSPDGRWIAAGPECELVLCDADSGAVVAARRAHDSPITALAWTSGSDAVATTGSWEREVMILGVPDLVEVARLEHTHDVRAVAIAPSGDWIATGTTNGDVHLWDASSLSHAGVLEGHTGMVTRLAFAPDATRLASASTDGTVHVWSVEARSLMRVLRGQTEVITSVAWDPTGSRLASTSEDGTLVTWEAESDELRRFLPPHSGAAWEVGWSPDGRRLVTASDDRSIRVWDFDSAARIDSFLGHEGGVLTVSFHPEGTRVLSSSYDGTLKEWSLETPPATLELRGHVADVTSVAFSPDGQRLVTTGRDTTLRIWDTATGDELAVAFGSARPTGKIDVSFDGSRLATGTATGQVALWSLQPLHEDALLPLHAGRVTAVAFHPRADWFASSSRDGTVVLWDASQAREVRRFETGGVEVICVGFSPDGGRLACGTWGGRLQVWNVATGEKELDLRGHDDVVSGICFSPGGGRLASASLDGLARVWDAADGRELQVLAGHVHALTSISFSPDGTRIATSARSGAIKLWDADSGLEVATLRGHADWVNDLRIGPRGRRLASVSSAGIVKVWDSVSPVGRKCRGAVSGAGSPEAISSSVWEIVCEPDREREAYELAHQRAWCLAVRCDPGEGLYQAILGAAEVRLGRQADALEALANAERRMGDFSPRARAATLAFLALARGASEENVASARRALEQLEILVAEHALTDERTERLLREVRVSLQRD